MNNVDFGLFQKLNLLKVKLDSALTHDGAEELCYQIAQYKPNPDRSISVKLIGLRFKATPYI